MLLDPGQHDIQGIVCGNSVGGQLITDDELRLPAASVQRRDRKPRRGRGDRGAVITLHHVQAQIETR